MVGASKIKNSIFAWLCALIVTLSLSETCVGEIFSYQWNESGEIEASTPEGTKENGSTYQYDASGYSIATNSGQKLLPYYPNINKFKAPGGRHTLTSVKQKTLTKKLNTVIEPGVDVAGDVRVINQGLASRVGNNYVVNGRTYGMGDVPQIVKTGLWLTA